MKEPSKIRVLYFDENPDSMARFIGFCGPKELIDIVGAFHSIHEICALFQQDHYRFFKTLSPDVIVIRLESFDMNAYHCLSDLKRIHAVKIIALLSHQCIRDGSYSGVLDYATEAPSACNLMSDEDAYMRIIYQIKTARLKLNMEKAGVKGTWVVLPLPPPPASNRKINLIAIGASAGGTEALTTILSDLPPTLPPMVVVQHIPENFTAFFANNLNARIASRVVVAQDSEKLEPGKVYIAGNDKHLEVVGDTRGGFYARCVDGEKVSGHRPSVDALFASVAKAAGGSALGVILTGMGSDGAQGLLEMRKAGAYTIGQDKDSSYVYGMPMVAYTLGAVSQQLPLNAIAKAIISAAENPEEGGGGIEGK